MVRTLTANPVRRAATVPFVALALIAVIAIQARAQTAPSATLDSYFALLPKGEVKQAGPQRYRFTCDYFQLDLQGNVTGKTRVQATYTRGLPDGRVRWADVTVAQAKTYDDPFAVGEPRTYMDGFTYAPADLGNASGKDVFDGFPNDMQTKTLVWDTEMFETYAWSYRDKLKLNEPYRLQLSDTPLPGGSFHNRQPELTWLGLSKRNGKLCALIGYEAFFNQVKFAANGITLNGSSQYWGTIWLSLADRQIEYATLREDVVSSIDVPGPNGKQTILINPFRVGTFERLP
jgi:hypothetical protein